MTEAPNPARDGRNGGPYRSPRRGRPPTISDIDFTHAPPGAYPDLLGQACVNVAGVVRILWIEVRRDPARGIRLFFPPEWQLHGRNPGIVPVDFTRTHNAIRRALLEYLGIDDPSARPRRRRGR